MNNLELNISQDLFGNANVNVVEQVYYDDTEKERYLNTFSALKENGYIAADFFNDHVWIMPCPIKANDFKLVFDIEIFWELNQAVKAFITLRRSSGVSPHKCYDELQLLKKTIRASNGFKKLDRLKQTMMSMSAPRAYCLSNVLKNFISFFSCDQGKEILGICNTVPFAIHGNRDLPHFHDVLIFNDIVNNFFQTKPAEMTLKFKPIMIWWLITTIIPQRPTEFLLMNKDCLEHRQDGSMWLKVPRIKTENDTPDRVIRYDSIQIDRKTYEIISSYKSKLTELGIQDDYLFPRAFYQLFRKSPKRQAFNRVTLYNFDLLLQEFYTEVVEGVYLEKSLEKVKLGDTRHFAIINMFLQGFNMLSIARMAGHDVIATQENYYSHSEHFSQSYVYILAQHILERKISDTIPEGFIGWRRDAYDRGKIYNDQDTLKMLKVDYGYCKEKIEIFPTSCVEDCRQCNHYVFKPDIDKYEQGIKWLQDNSDFLNQRIKEILSIMKEQCSSSLLSSHPGSEEILKTNSMNLVKYMNQKAMVDSKLMEEDRYD
ncbi:site-specific integrase [Cytobacillus firmus]